MSGDINENTNLSSDEVSTSTPTEQEATVPEPELMSELKSEILAPLTEGGVGEGIVEAVTEEAMGKQQLRPQTQGRPKKDQNHYNEDPEVLG
jgi:hypothetical protein